MSVNVLAATEVPVRLRGVGDKDIADITHLVHFAHGLLDVCKNAVNLKDDLLYDSVADTFVSIAATCTW